MKKGCNGELIAPRDFFQEVYYLYVSVFVLKTLLKNINVYYLKN
jgi:hypothetical protein